MQRTGNALVRLALAHRGESYALGTLVPKDNPRWTGPWDCAEFCSWLVFQLTGELFGCRPRRAAPSCSDAYTGFWIDDARAAGAIVAIGAAAGTRGAFLVRQAGARVGHIAVSQGDGTTIEAHSAARGVTVDRVAGRRWDCGVLVPGLAVRTPAAPPPVPAPSIVLRVKRPAMKGALVKSVQRGLALAGFHPGPVDGIYGSQTAAAVRALQTQRGLAVDGEVGPLTARALGVAWY